MKPISVRLTLFLLALFVCVCNPLSAQDSLQAKYTQGVALFNQENYGDALILFEEVLQAKPDFVYARNYAAKCKAALAKNLGPKNDLEQRLKKVVLPEIAFVDASLQEVLDYLVGRTQELTKGEIIVNFIFLGTPEQRDSVRINLNLRNTPLTEVIKYLAMMGGFSLKYEPHAVVIQAGSTVAPAPVAAPAP